MNIFIVDDDDSILKLYKIFLEFKGYVVIDHAKNGIEAVDKYIGFKNKPDFIIMDYHMPYKNGIEATQAILEIEKTAKIIIVSGDSSIKEKALASGAICFKEKPFNISELSQQINFLKMKLIKN